MPLTSKGIDIRALRAGQNIEFDFDLDKAENFKWEDEEEDKIDYEKIYRYRNSDMIPGNDEDEEEENGDDIKLPFDKLRPKMYDVTTEKNRGVLKRILTPGVGLPVPNGSMVRSEFSLSPSLSLFLYFCSQLCYANSLLRI